MPNASPEPLYHVTFSPQRLALVTEQILWLALCVAGACLEVQRRSAVGYHAGLETTAELLGPSLGGRPSDNSECLCFCKTCRTPDCRLKKRERVEEGSRSLRWCRNSHPTLHLGIACLNMSRCTCNLLSHARGAAALLSCSHSPPPIYLRTDQVRTTAFYHAVFRLYSPLPYRCSCLLIRQLGNSSRWWSAARHCSDTAWLCLCLLLQQVHVVPVYFLRCLGACTHHISALRVVFEPGEELANTPWSIALDALRGGKPYAPSCCQCCCGPCNPCAYSATRCLFNNRKCCLRAPPR